MRPNAGAGAAATLAALAVLSSTAGCGDPSASTGPAGGGRATVVEVVDGDTVVLDLGGRRETARLLGIDAPETHHPRIGAECGGAEATERLRALLPEGSPVDVVRDTEARDRFDRLLVHLFRRPDRLHVNLALAEAGAVDVLTIAPNRAWAVAIAAAVARARSEQRGLWGRCGSADRALEPP